MMVFLTGRRGSGKTTLSHGLEELGYLRVHAASIAESRGLTKDELGVYVGLAECLHDTLDEHHGDIVVDGSPRTRQQASMVRELSTSRACIVIVLDADEELSGRRMRERGNETVTIERAHQRWREVEQPALEDLPLHTIDARLAPERILQETLLHITQTSHRTNPA